jgi:hypothetical protein
MYSKKDIELLKDNMSNINYEIKKIKSNLFEPTHDNIKIAYDIIYQFLMKKKRKIYGGVALNALIIEKNKNDAIYDEYDVPDIDFYSPDPINDLFELCDLLQEKSGYIMAREALHLETYVIRYYYHEICNVSYVPINIYNKIPFITINNLIYTNSNFLAIDCIRMLTDPMTSYWRIDKSFQRFQLLNEYYPFKKYEMQLSVGHLFDANTDIDTINIDINKFIMSNVDSLIIIGMYAYNHFISKSDIMKSNNKKINFIKVPYYEIISINYVKDAENLINILSNNPIYGLNIKAYEFYPYFQFLGYYVKIYHKDTLIAIIYDHNNRCTPYLKLYNYVFDNNQIIKNQENVIHIGTFLVVFLYIQYIISLSRTNDDLQMINTYNVLSSNMLEMRKYFFSNHDTNVFDNKIIFQDFVTICKGETIPLEILRMRRIEQKKKLGKPFIFQYDPSKKEMGKKTEIQFIFANSSGRKINNVKNLKLKNSNNLSFDTTTELNNESINEINNENNDNLKIKNTDEKNI